MDRARLIAASVVSLGLMVGSWAIARQRAPADGCEEYLASSGLLVAHAGGGLPTGTYQNSIAALDVAARHGFRLIEIDFRQVGNDLSIGHDRPSGLSMDELAGWLRAHPSTSLVTDIKTENLAGLAIMKRELGTSQVIPQIYQPDQFAPAKALGFSRVIFAERIGESRGWFPWVNSADLWAVTIPARREAMRQRISKPTFLYTVNEPGHGNTYTDCLVPRPEHA